MKLDIKVGDKVLVLKGKDAGKEANVVAVDKRSYRYRLEGLKVQTVKSKKGASRDLHGTYHLSSIKKVIVEAPAQEAAEG